MSFDIPFVERNRKSLFDEQLTANRTPVVQVMSRNGLRDDVLSISQGAGAGTSVTDYKYNAASGTDPFGVSSINTKLKGSYKPGQALECGGTFIFGNPTGACFQVFGFVTAEDIIAFARSGTIFGLIVSTYNATEIQTLTVTTPAAGSENATVQINGVNYSVPLTAGTVELNAAEIGEYFRANPVPNYTITANGPDVIALSGAPVPAGAFSFSSATAVASWVQNRAGALPNYAADFIPATSWPDAPAWVSSLDVTKLNVGTIELGFYGAKGISFKIDNPDTGVPEEVYFYKYLNTSAAPIVLNPSLSVGWAVQNAGNTTNISVEGSSAAIFVQGEQFIDEPPLSQRATQTTTATDVTNGDEVNILSIRNRSVYGGTINAVDVYSIVLSLRNESNKEGTVILRLNPDYDRAMEWSYYDPTNSVIEVSTTKSVITGGTEQFSFEMTKEGVSGFVDLKEFIGKLTPRNILSVGFLPSAAGVVKATFNWKEDQ